jgi:hypothetical protein
MVTYLYTENKLRSAYIDTIPKDISDAFFDNLYTNSQGCCIDRLTEAVFGDLAEDVFWFIHECEDNNVNPNVSVEDRDYYINDLETYFEYAQKELFKNDN